MLIIKTIKYFVQAIFVYLFFIIIKIIGLTLSRKLFSFLFNKIGPLLKSEKVINDNLEKFLGHQNIDIKQNYSLRTVIGTAGLTYHVKCTSAYQI